MYIGLTVEDFKEFRLRIQGVIEGVEIAPETIPMSRLLEYLTDLALMMGHKESVHFLRVEEGSAQPVFLVAADEEHRVSSRMQLAQRGQSTRDANLAYKRFDQRLREDNAVAEVSNESKKAKILSFPGRNQPDQEEYRGIKEPGELIGEVKRVGGLDDTVPIWLKRNDGQILYCDADERTARELGNYLYKRLRVFGVGSWTRRKDGTWNLDKFRIRSFDPAPLSSDSVASTFEQLRAIKGNEWTHLEDPYAEAALIRDGGGSAR